MRILHISTIDYGGAGLACIRLHKGLLENGYKSKVLVLKKTSEYPEVYKFEKYSTRLPKIIRWPMLFFKLVLHKLRIPASRLLYYQYKVDSLRAKSSPVYSLPLSANDLSRHQLVIEADLIHLHWTAGFLDWPSFFKNVSKPVVWTVHDENLYFGGFHYRKEQIDNILIYRKLEDKLLEIKQKSIQHCKNLSIISLSKMMLELSLSESIVRDRKHYLIHNMVDHSIFMPFEKKFAREVFRLPQDKKILFFISYYLNDLNKGFTEILKAMNDMKIPELILFAVGKGKADIETSNEIYYPGTINDPKLLSLAYSASDIYVMPSFQEGFAQTPLEAMACGIPVVAYPCSGTEELINEKNGIRAKDFTINSLKDSISKSLNIKYDREWIQNDVIARFGVKKAIEQYASVYKAAINDQVKYNESTNQ